MPEAQTKSLAIFRAGRHTAVDGRVLNFSNADIAAIAAGYQPDTAEAPLVIGHPSLDAPAYGWVKSLSVRDGVLYAEPQQVEPQFAELVNAGRMKKISASMYLPDSPGNPTPGKFYLRHVGFLGAAAPAVKGLPSAQFAADADAVEFAGPLNGVADTLVDMLQRIRDWFVEREGADKADQIIPSWQIRSIDDAARADDGAAVAATSFAASDPGATLETDMPADKAADFAEREAALAKQTTDITAREAALAKREAEAKRADVADFAEGLVKAGKLLPREKAPVVEVLLALPAAPVSFAEGDGTVEKPAADILRGLLDGLPKRIDYAEKSGATHETTAPASFAAPNGELVDPTQLETLRKAKAYQAEHANVSLLDAVRAVGG